MCFHEYISALRSPSQQHLVIWCDDSMMLSISCSRVYLRVALSLTATGPSSRMILRIQQAIVVLAEFARMIPGNPSVPRRVDSSLSAGFSGREIGADTRSIHNRMGDYSARMGAFQSDPTTVHQGGGDPGGVIFLSLLSPPMSPSSHMTFPP